MRNVLRVLILPLIGCSFPQPAPPRAEFIVADATTTYWVKSGPQGITARTSPLILTNADNRFYELYVGEVTRSYEDAIFVREPIYRRDVLSGDSKMLFEDKRISAWEKSYLRTNPGAELIDPEDAAEEDITLAATGEAEILAIAGPYVVFDRWSILERGRIEEADSARTAVDIRSGEAVSLATIAWDSATLASGAIREEKGVRWKHGSYEVHAHWDEERGETAVVLRDRRRREWVLGYVDSRVPRIFWLDQPGVDGELRTALYTAFEDARADVGDVHLVRSRSGEGNTGLLHLATRRR